MKKFLSVTISLLLCVLAVAGCGCNGKKETVMPTEAPTVLETTEKPELLPFEDTITMVFASGAGSWGTVIYLSPDGSFSGSYSDTEMGLTGEGYDATCYVCDFVGNFKDIKMTDDYAFTMKLDSVTTVVPVGTEWIEDSVRYLAADPIGIAGGEDFVFYLPTTPKSQLNEEFLYWNMTYDDTRESLGCYGLYNVITDSGFFTYD